MITKRDWLGISLNVFSTLATFGICVLLITVAIDYHFLPRGYGRLCWAVYSGYRDLITMVIPLLFIFPLASLWKARRLSQDIYISSRFFAIGMVVWLGACLYVM